VRVFAVPSRVHPNSLGVLELELGGGVLDLGGEALQKYAGRLRSSLSLSFKLAGGSELSAGQRTEAREPRERALEAGGATSACDQCEP